MAKKVNTPETDRFEAFERRLETIQNLILAGLPVGATQNYTFADSVASYLESGGSPRFMGRLLEHFGTKAFREITQDDLQKAARDLYPGCTPETLNRQCYTPFIAVYNHAVDNRRVEARKWRRPRKQKGTGAVKLKPQRSGNRPVSYDRAAQFVVAMSPAPGMLMTCFFFTGMRPIEAFALDCSDVDIDGRWIVVRSSKTGEPRGVPMHEFLAPMFASLVTRGGKVFRTHKGSPYPLAKEYGGQMSKAIAGARKRCDIKNVSPYTGRHSASTQLVVNGVHPHIKDQILGHAATDMSRHYTNVPQKELIEAINTIEVPELWTRLGWWDDVLGGSRKLLPIPVKEEKEMRG